MTSIKKVYLLIDIENVSTKNRKEELCEMYEQLFHDGYAIYKIGLAAKDIQLLNDWKIICHEIFGTDLENIKILKAATGYDTADMALCFMAGYWCKENEIEKLPFIILSNDKLLKKVEIHIKQLDIECLEYKINTNSWKKCKEKPTLSFNEELYPYGYDSPSICIPYLRVITHPTKTDHPITYIPIPNIGEEISIGGGDYNSDLHVSLNYWDQGNHSSLYSIHAYMGYKSNNQLYIRSAKGFRRGVHSVEINNVIINSANGNLALKDGDIIKIGGFVFKIIIPISHLDIIF